MKSQRFRRVWKACAPVCVLAIALAGGASAEPPKAAKTPPPKPSPAVASKAPAPQAPQPYGYPNSFIERHAKRLGLSDETVKNIRETVEKSRGENERIRKQVEEAHVELRKLLAVDMPDETVVMVQADKITALVGEQRKNQLRASIKVRSLLTPAQRAELDKIRKEQPVPRRGPGGPPPPHDKKKPPFGAGPHGKPPPTPGDTAEQPKPAE